MLPDSITVARFEVFTAVKMEFVGFWVVVLCRVVVGYHHFEGLCCLKMEAAWFSEILVISQHTTMSYNPENHKFHSCCWLKTLSFWMKHDFFKCIYE
jgi:hypothetical protein